MFLSLSHVLLMRKSINILTGQLKEKYVKIRIIISKLNQYGIRNYNRYGIQAYATSDILSQKYREYMRT